MSEIKEFLSGWTGVGFALVSLIAAIVLAWEELLKLFHIIFKPTARKGPSPKTQKRLQLVVAILFVLLFIVFVYFAFLPPPPPPANTPPHIGHVANQTVQAGGTAGPFGFEVSDAETSAAALSVTAASSNLALVPVSGISHGGTGEKRTISLTPVAGQTGTTTITLTVTDAGGLTATDTFTVDVPPFTREQLLKLAWDAHNAKRWNQVVEVTTILLEDFERPADKEQEELTKLKAPAPKTGRVGVDLSDADVRSNHKFGLTNDVATALYVRGMAYSNLGKKLEARADWKKVMTFDHAVTFDLRTMEFWRTKEGAENKLFQLDSKK